jgi:23S rRNA pseudouridine1911/1915/1917 synthase
MTSSFTAEEGRLDTAVAQALGISRGDAQRAIEEGRVLVDGVARAKSFRLAGGEAVEAALREPGDLPAEAGPLDVRLEDEHLLVLSKSPGMPVHPTAARRDGTLVNRLLGNGISLFPGDDPDRPGIVHRLDAGTSGLMVVAKDEAAYRGLAEQFRRHAVVRRYLALVRGSLANDRVLIEAPLERRGARIVARATTGKAATTEVEVRERFDRATLVEARPRTGRTHQIRVHLSSAGHPILGDRRYGGGGDIATRLGLERPFLHSWSIAFDHPVTGERVELEDPLPEDLQHALTKLRGAAGAPAI